MGSLTFTTTDATSWSSNPSVTAWNTVRTAVLNDLKSATGFLTCPTNVTISINFGYGDVGGQPLSGQLGASLYFVDSFSYGAVRSALIALTPNSLQSTAYNSSNLPISDPLPPSGTVATTYNVTVANAKAVGLDSGTFLDGYCGFSSTGGTFDLNSTGTSCQAGMYSLYGTILHEITEVMGRAMYGSTQQSNGSTYYPGDLFTYSTTNTRNITSTGNRFISADGHGSGAVVVYMNQNFGTDPGDFGGTGAGNPTPDACDAFGTTGFVPKTNSLNPGHLPYADMSNMTIIGWGLTSNGLLEAGIGNTGNGVFSITSNSTIAMTSSAVKSSSLSITANTNVDMVGAQTTPTRRGAHLGQTL